MKITKRIWTLSALGAFVTLVVAFSGSTGQAQASPGDHGKGADSSLVAFDEDVTEAEARDIARDSGLDDGLWMPELQTLEVTAGPVGMSWAKRSINGHRRVKFVEDNPSLSADSVPNDTSYVQQWAPKLIGAETAWDTTTGSAGIIVAVLDTGLDLDHPEFAGKTVPGWDFYNNDADPSDDNGHGTHVTGVIGALTNNALGIASIGRNTTVMPVKVLSQNSGGNHATAASGILWAVDHGARIINLSLGSTATSSTLERAVNYAYKHGVLAVASAGNGNTSTPFYPAAYANAMAIGASDSSDARYSLSNDGRWLAMVAPGVSIYSTNWGPSA